jgi:hypothetical protein
MSFPCSKDGKGRSRLLLIDPIEEKVIGLYLGGGNMTHEFVTPFSQDITDVISRNIPWEKYK